MMTELTTWLRSMPSVQDIDWQLKKAAAVREWCLRELPFREGDRVRIARQQNTDNGWRGYRECLAVGATAVVKAIDFNPYSLDGEGAWQADIKLDREWAQSDWHDGTIRRWWHGPASETPVGMDPPSDYEQKNYPEGRKHLFSVLVDSLAAVERCPACDGTGRRFDQATHDEVMRRTGDNPAMGQAIVTCPDCGGSGYVD